MLIQDYLAVSRELSRTPDEWACQAKSVICQETSRACERRFGQALEAVVLTGSMARDEATFVEVEPGCLGCLGDAEFVLVFKTCTALPSGPAIHTVRREIEASLEARRVRCKIGFSLVHPIYLRKVRPHLYAYELRNCGQVKWGDARILSLIPEFCPSDIPLEDAWRLLSNRMTEQVALVHHVVSSPARLTLPTYYATVKLYLDMATSLLLFAGAYAATYGERSKRIRGLAENAEPGHGYPFPLGDFAGRVEACTQWKLSRAGPAPGDDGGFWEAAVIDARKLWIWELVRLTGAREPLTRSALIEAWFRKAPVRERARGWARVVRECGWHRSWREWPRWARLAWRASPRFWVYRAAAELFFALPSLAGTSDDSASNRDWLSMRDWLPIRRCRREVELPSWQRLADDIVWNYQEFLTGTRA